MKHCFTFGFNLSNDINDRLKSTITRLAGWSTEKANILAGYVMSNDFLEYCKQSEKYDANKSLAENNQNTVYSLLKEYYLSKHQDTIANEAKRQAESLVGFSSVTAKKEALDYTATITNLTYYRIKGLNAKVDYDGVVRDVINEIQKDFFRTTANIIAIEHSDDENAIKYNKLKDEFNKLAETLSKTKNPKEKKEIRIKLAELNREMYNHASIFVDKFGNERQKNHANVVRRIKSNPTVWFNDAWKSEKVVNIANELYGVLDRDIAEQVDYVDDADAQSISRERVDSSTKAWEDHIWDNFDQAVANDLKMYFNTLFKLSAPAKIGDEVVTYDTDNTLGVKQTMGANFIIRQLLTWGNFNSVDDFIDSIDRMSQQIYECYGLIAIANRMNNDRLFANRVFNQLNNPKIIKTMTILNENGIDFIQSNKTADALSYMVYTMLNTTRSTMTDVYTDNDIDEIKNLQKSLKNKGNDFLSDRIDENNNYRQEHLKYENIIYNIIKKYYPHITINALRAALYSDQANVKQNYNDILNNIEDLLNKVKYTVGSYNTVISENNNDYAAWARAKTAYEESGAGTYTVPKPVTDYSRIDYSKLNTPIVNLCKKLVNYSAVKNELNSMNAEGNLSADILDNSWITNTLRQIAYGNKNDADAGLKVLLKEVENCPQYAYNSLFWGIKGDKGYIQEGLFFKDGNGKTTINKRAREIITISLFNGIREHDNSNSVLYSSMSKGDYFLTNLLAFHNPIAVGENLTKGIDILKQTQGGYFMRVPSDAPKNFIVQAPKLKSAGIIEPSTSSKQKYLQERRYFINKLEHDSDQADNYIAFMENYVLGATKGTDKNVKTATNIYEFITHKEDNINVNGMTFFDNGDGTYSVPLIYLNGQEKNFVWLRGQKVQGETDNILYDLEVDYIDDTTGSLELGSSFFADLTDILTNEGIENGSIEIKVNRNIDIFKGLKQDLLGELNNFIEQLNQIFEKDRKTNKWKLKKSIDGRIDNAHYKGNSFIEYNDNSEQYRLSGNFFKFIKLFETNGYNVNEEMVQQLFLYGGESTGLIHATQKGATINMRHPLIQEREGRLTLLLDKETNNIIDDITENWIKNYSKEVAARTQQYRKVLETVYNTENQDKFRMENVMDCMLNTAHMYMNFDDIFEGDAKFYKDAQTFLKRAKEVQAQGKSYAGFDLNDSLSQPIKELQDKIGNPYEIKFGKTTLAKFAEAYSPVEVMNPTKIITSNARNGFKAVTIRNTTRTVDYANHLEQDLIDNLKTKMSEEQATKIARNIVNGWKQDTKVNDAQSYITIEEFIRRKYADGTLNEYTDLLNEILAVRKGEKKVEDIDLSKINARIQVQKNFYYDLKYDAATRTRYPRQIKNAEFVLIPELLEGTELKGLYDMMIKHGIDQINTLETSKAANKDTLVYWDNNGNLNPNFEEDLVRNNYGAVDDYYYRFLYKQQDNHQHMVDEVNKAGIQILKKMIDNADLSIPEVKSAVNKFFDNYVANIKEDYNKLLFNMGWKVDKDGKITNIDGNSQILDFTEFYKRARHEAQRLGLDENFLEYITPGENGVPAMPNWMNNVSSKLESIAQAIFNRGITRQTLPGYHCAQVTSLGHGRKALDSTGKLRELQYRPEIKDENGNVIQQAYIECLVPRWSNLIPKDYPIEKLEQEGLDLQLIYRIPTEGKQSTAIVKVVGFLDDVYGSSIMLPHEWVTQTGADFDNDSVYAIVHELHRTKDAEGNILIKKFTGEVNGGNINNYSRYLRDYLEDKLPTKHEDPDGNNKYRKAFNEIEDIRKSEEKPDYKRLNQIAKEVGLPTFNEWQKYDEVDRIPRRARNNNILDAMLTILQHPSSFEENVSRSNFDDVTKAMKEMDNARGATKAKRSAYNPLDQIDFFENAMSGAALKAFSVSRDTFNSVTNKAGARLAKGREFWVEYSLSTGEYDYQTIVDAYGLFDKDSYTGDAYPIDKNGKYTENKDKAIAIRVRHRRLANSNNNRNVVGSLITVYSSETTAHILDAIKEGAVFNENMYTFGTFKTMIDAGVDYRTAVAFIMQPGITVLNEVNNETNSIYINENGNSIQKAIIRIAANAGYTIDGKAINEYTRYEDVINTLNKDERFRNAINQLFSANLEAGDRFDEHFFNLNVSMLKNRLKGDEIINISGLSEEDKTIQDAAYDIAMVLTFERIHDTTQNIERNMRLCNPDKFGAKQTIRSTRTIKQNIEEYGFNDNPIGNTIKVGDKNLLQVLYSGFMSAEGIKVKDSVYPYLAAFMKYATLPSIEINSTLFPTENYAFAKVLDVVQTRIGKILNEEQYREYKQYMIANLYNTVPYITMPIDVNEEGWLIPDIKTITEYQEKGSQYWNEEISRIYGYQESRGGDFTIKNIHKPTKEEINNFKKLTPLQKVVWIQTNIPNNHSITDFLNVNKFNQYEYKNKGYSQQTIKFVDTGDVIDEVYRAFDSTFFNKSPIYRLLAIDLIKYAFIVEGFKFKRGGISKIITNRALYKNIEDGGTNIIPLLRSNFQQFSNIKENATEEFIDKFVRSHSEYVKEVRLGKKVNKNNKPNAAYLFNTCLQGDSLIYIPYNKKYEDLLITINLPTEREEIIEGVPEEQFEVQNYVRITTTANNNKKSTVLYKIHKTDKGIYLMPMNLLERNETGDYSVNKNNNKYPKIEYFKSLIDIADSQDKIVKELISGDGKLQDIEARKKNAKIPRFEFTKINESLTNTNEFQRVQHFGTITEKGFAEAFMKQVEQYMSTNIEDRLDHSYVRSDGMVFKDLFPLGVPVIQYLTIDGKNVPFEIVRSYQPKNFKASIANKTKLKESDLPGAYKIAYENAFAAGAQSSTYYKITPITETQVREKIESQDEAYNKRKKHVMSAITRDITDEYIENIDASNVVDDTAKMMIEALKRAQKLGDINAIRAIRSLDIRKIDEFSAKDLERNRKSIYSILANYTELSANLIKNELENYSIENNKFNIGKDDLYEALKENPEEVEKVIDLLLKSITFGDTFGEIMSLPFDSLDDETKQYVKRIRNAIISVKNHSSVKNGFDKMFNNYIANEFSTNPNIRTGLVDLKDTFGDAGWWESWIGDIHMINNKQIQTIVSVVERIMNDAILHEAPRAKDDFLAKYDDILKRSKNFNWDKIVDNNGRLVRKYNNKFFEEKNRLREEIELAEENYGTDSLEDIWAKLRRDEFYADNVEQLVSREYYVAKNAQLRHVLETAPQLYIEWKAIQDELYEDDRPSGILTKEERDRRKNLQEKAKQLSSDYYSNGVEKSIEDKIKAAALRDFITGSRNLNQQYFDYIETEGFKTALKNNLDYIARYDRDNPRKTFDEKMEDEDYKNAYEWIEDNSNYKLNKDAEEAINKAFEELKDEDNTKHFRIRTIMNNHNAYDDYGNYDPRKLPAEAIAQIKEITMKKYRFNYDSNAGEAVLLKDIPEGLPVLTDEFYRLLRDPSENEQGVNARRLETIKFINDTLSKVIGQDGRIHAKDIFEKLTEEEIDNLVIAYKILKNIKGKRKPKELRERFKKNVEFKTNDVAFNEELSWALSNIKGTKDYAKFIAIFVQTDSYGEIQLDDDGHYVPNSDIYGYILPKDNKYVDKKKTEARKLLNDNVTYVPTQYYRDASTEATREGRFDDWYEANHVYNPYSHKFEPLKIWTEMRANPNGSLKGTYSYVPTNDNTEKHVKEEFINPKYKKYGINYNSDNGNYNQNITRTAEEEEMYQLLETWMNFFAKHNTYSPFIDQGFIPRRGNVEMDTKWAIGQALGTVGLEFRNDSNDRWYNKVDYAHDHEAENDMLSLLRGKGYQQTEEIRRQSIGESDADYTKYVKEVRKRNEEIKAKNLEIDNALMDKDYRAVFAEAIQKQILANAKNKSKNWLYLLQEDLRHNEAIAINGVTNRLRRDNTASTDVNEKYATTPQTRALDVVDGFIHRMIFDQFHKQSKGQKYADLARNITSAKYMILNVTGGVANVGTGFANIMNEAFAGDSFTTKDINDGVAMYRNNMIRMLADMYKDTSDNFAVALTKHFDVVNFDDMLERVPGESAGEYVRRVRNALYGLQSGGEHMMQNSVLFAMLKSNKIFMDIDGTKRVGNFQQYTWKAEYDTLVSVIQNNSTLLDDLKIFKASVKVDKQEAYKYDTFQKNLVEEFLRTHGNKELINKYIAARNTRMKELRKEFIKLPTLIDQYEVVNGRIKIKENSELTETMDADFRNTVINVNKFIHGVYDKIGAARIEFDWYGGLVMQYHKHLYPGIMKRYRRNAYYNEQTKLITPGSYSSLIRFMTRGFRGFEDRVKSRKNNGEQAVLASINEVFKSTLDSIINIKTNWNLMPQWERNACKRCLGDMYGILAAITMAIGIYALTDDDDEKDSELVATLLYISDRLFSESQMYLPWGMVTEARTLWSSPIAATNSITDALKAMEITSKWLFDENYDLNYSTGQFAGENRLWVLLRRNIPMYRVFDRLSRMTKNNSYYRINDSSWNMKIARTIADGKED